MGNFDTGLARALGLNYPLIVAPMAGGPSSPALVAAASNAGALGSIGAAYLAPDAIRKFAREVRGQTAAPFAINLFLPEKLGAIADAARQNAIIATSVYRRELGLPEPKLLVPFEEDFDSQFSAVMELRPAVLSFVFGLLKNAYVREARQRGIFLLGTATSLAEAELLEEAGVDAITLQGFEAGGHRGTFRADAPDPQRKTFDLLGDCAGKIKIPLVAAGGLMNAKHVDRALGEGAQAVQLGTAFLACQEAGTVAPYRAALLASKDRDTKTTRVFSGRLARGIKNRFMAEMEARNSSAILPFPAQNKFTRDLRAASAARGSAELLSLWAGAGEGELFQGPCETLIRSLFAAAE